MPYYTDTVTSFTLLKSAIETYCVVNGWTLSDGILSKDSCFFKLIDSSTAYLQLWGGLSQTGPTLNSTPSYGVALKNLTSYDDITWPIRYHLFIFNDPIEVYCFIEYNSISYQHISFGKSNLSGIGLGAWFTGSLLSTSGLSNNFRINTTIVDISTFSVNTPPGGNLLTGMFCTASSGSYYNPSFIYSDLDSSGWKNIGYAASRVAGLLSALPNLLNQATVLLPIKAVLTRSSGGLTILANLINSRLLRIDNHDAKDIITFGSEQWMVFPWYRRDIITRTPATGGETNKTGTFGFAIKYEV